MLEFIDNLNEWQFYAFITAVFLGLGVFSKGAVSVKWSKGKAISGVVNFAFLKLTFFYSGLFFFALPLLKSWYGAQGFPQISREFWESVPLPLAALALLLVYDFGVYWSDKIEAYDKNFASIFPFYDKMFGTYYNPHSAFDMPTGIGEHTPGHNLVALTAWPFMEWGRMIAAKLSSDEKAPEAAASET